VTLHANYTETPKWAVFTIFTTSPGDANDPGYYAIGPSPYDHVMLLVEGHLTVSEDGGEPFAVKAPGVIRIKAESSYWFQNIQHGQDPLQPNVLYCIHNKSTPGWDGRIEPLVELLRAKNNEEVSQP
jgi:hypothetical protein